MFTFNVYYKIVSKLFCVPKRFVIVETERHSKVFAFSDGFGLWAKLVFCSKRSHAIDIYNIGIIQIWKRHWLVQYDYHVGESSGIFQQRSAILM